MYGVPVSLIAETNKLTPPYAIKIGQLLEIPPGVSYYVVQHGDTMVQIAKRFNVTTAVKVTPGIYRRPTNSHPQALIRE